MSEPYPGTQAISVPLLGRESMLKKLEACITKESADHISVVGPPYIGKTTLLKHLYESFRPGRNEYITSCYLDLRHPTPESDDAFRSRFAAELKIALEPFEPEVSAMIEPNGAPENLAAELPGIFGYFEGSARILVVMDGLDHFLAKSNISRNLWDYLRDIAQKPSCTLVTGSREPLRELCKNPDSQTSDFWNIFRDPLVLGPFEDSERDIVLAPMLGATGGVEEPARKELMNWTGGHPALFALLAGRVCEAAGGKAVDKGLVDGVAQDIVGSGAQLLQELWDNCPVEVQGDIYSLATAAPGAGNIPIDRVRFGARRGFIDDKGKHPKAGARLVQKLAELRGGNTPNLRRLFGEESAYMATVRAVPELRLAQLKGVNAPLRQAVDAAIRNIEVDPGIALLSFRVIADRAVRLVLQYEVPGGKTPDHWVAYWEKRSNDWALRNFKDGMPTSLGMKCSLLDEVTSTAKGKDKLANFISRSTYVMLEHVKQIGDLGAHPDGIVSPAYASACCLVAVELCETLARELR